MNVRRRGPSIWNFSASKPDFYRRKHTVGISSPDSVHRKLKIQFQDHYDNPRGKGRSLVIPRNQTEYGVVDLKLQ
ncbi:hypothetical protein PEX1_059420 [Penicillium expansum]|uniref:Uncharacterized protein n=1 Tax=Penicillium expansum TaxID=27334 RepID=A0A0A2KUA0_PENEN|nr:hypothetical protein PEX2_089490 [Penicillium expansum]KGO40371.1 hypothetical protein PEXP_031860 [Penicillium expansum]KGO54964.1 hypothetical protein PEX2_089490 [Penicillium expansum]KGO70498.1 hypothetical protein PEX1_059420 [Penicillium expansum]